MTSIARLFVHTASVETFLGSGATGDAYDTPATVKGFLDDGIIRQQTSSGEDLLQRSVFYAALADAPKFAPQSRVTVNGREAFVSQVRYRDGGDLFGPVEHVEVDLT